MPPSNTQNSSKCGAYLKSDQNKPTVTELKCISNKKTNNEIIKITSSSRICKIMYRKSNYVLLSEKTKWQKVLKFCTKNSF